MSHKTSPLANRLPLNKAWRSKWFSEHTAYLVNEDAVIRKLIDAQYGKNASIEGVEITRSSQGVRVLLHTGKPGMVIGRGGAGIQLLRTLLERKLQSFRHRNLARYVHGEGDRKQLAGMTLKIDIVEIKIPELHAALVAQSIAHQIERRIAYRRAVRQAIEKTMQRNAKGIKVSVSGRIGGSDIARQEKFSEGTVPLSTFRNDIDYAQVVAKTTSFGTIGVKVWIYRGDRLAEALKPQSQREG